MIQRSECLYNGEIIGIESIYTVIDGKQINIPNKVETLRKLGREGLLRCPCECGTKLILVASDRGLRQQHFRARNGESWSGCTLKQEGMNSIDSKIVIKCWLADKIDQNIETRVPINSIADTSRKYEVSHYIPSKHFIVNYTNFRINLEDEKLNILNDFFGDNTLYIVDRDNMENFFQYPEFMNKIQSRQKYCLFLEIDERDYEKARLYSSFYEKDIDGFFKRVDMTEGLLKDYYFSEDCKLMYQGSLLIDIYERKHSDYLKDQENEKIRREDEQKKREAELLKRKAEYEVAEAKRKARIAEEQRLKKLRQEEMEKQKKLRREADLERTRRFFTGTSDGNNKCSGFTIPELFERQNANSIIFQNDKGMYFKVTRKQMNEYYETGVLEGCRWFGDYKYSMKMIVPSFDESIWKIYRKE